MWFAMPQVDLDVCCSVWAAVVNTRGHCNTCHILKEQPQIARQNWLSMAVPKTARKHSQHCLTVTHTQAV
jgi:hypothetical protein